MERKTFIVAAIITTIGYQSPTLAQSTSIDFAEIGSICRTSAEECSSIVEQIINQLKDVQLDDAELNSQIAVLAGAVLEATEGASSKHVAGLSNVLANIATASTDPRQSETIQRFAREMASGTAPSLKGLSNPVAASPT